MTIRACYRATTAFCRRTVSAFRHLHRAESFLEDIAKCEADCLLLDIHPGGIPGIDLQRQLTSSGTDLPVMFMTAIDNEDTRQEAFNAGCIAYLKKPFLAKRLIDAINRIVTTIY